MLEKPFTFDGRIRRSEYGISLVIYAFAVVMIQLIAATDDSFVFIFHLPALWFILAQGSKRCHDMGKSGMWQLVPFYFLWLLFTPGIKNKNKHGHNPKRKNGVY